MINIEPWQYLAFEWSMVCFTGVLMCLRLYTQATLSGTFRSRSAGTQLILEALVIVAWVSFLIQGTLDTVLAHHHGLDFGVGNLAPGKDVVYSRVAALKVLYTESILYLNTMYAIKGHMLLFYWTSLIPKSSQSRAISWTRRALVFTVVVSFVSWLLQILLITFFCHPISRNWSLDAKQLCTPLSNLYVYYFVFIPHIATDLMVYFLPIPVLTTVKFRKRKRILAFLSFGFGFLCVSFAAAQLITCVFPDVPITTNYMFTVMEQTWAILVVCVPAFKLFVRGFRDNRRARSVSEHTAFSRSKTSRSAAGLSNPEESQKSTATMHTRELTSSRSQETILLNDSPVVDSHAERGVVLV